MKNKNTDLNNILFEQLERLNDESLKGEDLTEEIQRAKSVADISSKIIDNSRLGLEAARFKAVYMGRDAVSALPEMLENKNEKAASK